MTTSSSTPPLVRLLGPVAVRTADGSCSTPARLDAAVLAHLALAVGRSVPVDDLADAVWAGSPPAGARNALQVKVSRLRRLLGPAAHGLQHLQGSYRLDLAPDDVDVHRFRALAREAAAAYAAEAPASAAALAHEALRLWRGAPLAELGQHPRLVAARGQLADQRAGLHELVAGVALRSPDGHVEAVPVLREVLADDPLRPHARLLLMRALDRAGRRSEALAVYDVGRQLLADETGLTPPQELQDEFERLLAAERRSARRERVQVSPLGVPPGAAATARWLAQEGGTAAALELALRGSWWWWLGGRRSEGRDLLEELVGRSAADTEEPLVLGATAWLSVFDAVSTTAEQALARGEAALREGLDLGWDRHASLAALLMAERLYQRGEPERAGFLTKTSRQQLRRTGDEWGLALVQLVAAKGELQHGAIARAMSTGKAAHRAFAELDDAAGQMMALDHVGYCAEVLGDLATSSQIHQRALDLARQVGSTEWQATQLVRLGSVQSLIGRPTAIATLHTAAALAESVGSAAGVALAENGLGLAHVLTGDAERASEIHAAALAWYERQGSPAGISYTAGRLADSLSISDRERAFALAQRSLQLASTTRDPRAVAHALEAVALTHEDAAERARALGGARALRRRSRAPLPAAVGCVVSEVQRQLEEQLGESLLGHLRAGARMHVSAVPA